MPITIKPIVKPIPISMTVSMIIVGIERGVAVVSIWVIKRAIERVVIRIERIIRRISPSPTKSNTNRGSPTCKGIVSIRKPGIRIPGAATINTGAVIGRGIVVVVSIGIKIIVIT